MDYTEFVLNLLANKPVEYFKGVPIPTCRLWQVINNTDNIDIIDYYVDKLPHDKAVRTAVMKNKLEIADLLLSKQVEYNPKELQFLSPESIEWAKRHNIDISIEQVRSYNYDVDLVRALLSCYPQLLQDMKLCKCISVVLTYILTNYDVIVTDELVRHILHTSNYECFRLIVHKINPCDYIKEIAMSRFDIVNCALLYSHLTINDFGMSLFTGDGIKLKLDVFSPRIEDFAVKAKECNLIQSLIDNNSISSAFYLLQHYGLCIEGLSDVDTAKAIVMTELEMFLKIELVSESELLEFKDKLNGITSVTDVIDTYMNRSV